MFDKQAGVEHMRAYVTSFANFDVQTANNTKGCAQMHKHNLVVCIQLYPCPHAGKQVGHQLTKLYVNKTADLGLSDISQQMISQGLWCRTHASCHDSSTDANMTV